MNAHKIIF